MSMGSWMMQMVEGEFIQWEPWHMIAAMTSAYQCTEVAKERPIEVIDRAMI